MTVDQAVELGRAAMLLTLTISGPVMLVAMVVGLIISMLQAVTQLQDQTLSFVPKIIAMFVTILYVLPWAITQTMEYSTELFRNIPTSL